MTCCCFWFSQPAMDTTRNENGSRPARIRRGYHPKCALFSWRRYESNSWTLIARNRPVQTLRYGYRRAAVVLSLFPRRCSTRPPRCVEGCLIARMLPASGELTIVDLVDMDSAIFLLAIACESVSGKNDGVPIVSQNVLYIFLKRTTRRRHGLLGKLVKALLAAVRSSDCAISCNVEVPVIRTSVEIPVKISTRKCDVRIFDDSFYWMCHYASSYLRPDWSGERGLCHRKRLTDCGTSVCE